MENSAIGVSSGNGRRFPSIIYYLRNNLQPRDGRNNKSSLPLDRGHWGIIFFRFGAKGVNDAPWAESFIVVEKKIDSAISHL